MEERVISELTGSIATSASGRPVVPDTSLSHPVSCSEPMVKSAPITPESSRVPNKLPTRFACTNMLQPSYDHDVPTDPEK